MRFETDEKIQAAIDAVYAKAANLRRGEVLTHGAIRAILGSEPHEGSWDHVVDMARRRLERDRGIATWPMTNVGYELLTVEDQLARLPRLRLKKGIRQVRRGRVSVDALPAKGLTFHQQRARVFVRDQMKASETQLRRELREQAALDRPTPVPARRPAPDFQAT